MRDIITSASSLLLTNATLVLRKEVIRGTLRIDHGCIADLDTRSTSSANAIDCNGDLVLPGLVELHTDNLEKHVLPRPQVRWPMRAAVLAHDAELAAAGITTVLNGITMGAVLADSLRHQIIDDCLPSFKPFRPAPRSRLGIRQSRRRRNF